MGNQQFFRTTPQDSFVAEGGRAIINCVIGDLAGRVQWTKDGLTLGKQFPRIPWPCGDYLHILQVIDQRLTLSLTGLNKLFFFSGYFRELPGFGRYAVLGTDDSGVFNLQINNATLGDEAVYECQVGPNGTNKPIRASARLNVLCKFIISILHAVVCFLLVHSKNFV